MTENSNFNNEFDNEKVFAEDDFFFVETEEISDEDTVTQMDESILSEELDSYQPEETVDNVAVDTENSDSKDLSSDDEPSAKTAVVKKKGVPTRKLCGMAVLTALAVVLACAIHIPYFGASFLEYSPSDVPVFIAAFMYGPVWGLVITAIVSMIQGLTVSAGSGWIGIAMNFLSTGVVVLVSGFIYKFKRDIKGATIGIIAGCLSGVATMILWNILITPVFMKVERDVVLTMIPTVFLPFNILKYAGNGAMTFSLYKATGKFFKVAFSKVPDKTVDDDSPIEGKHTSRNVEDTENLAKRLADTLEGGEVIVLDGDLGAGKTTFTKGLAKALGVEGEVTSPTFTIMNVYEDGKLKLNHLDMYRIEHEDELYELGVEDAMSEDTVTVIEWNKLPLEGKKVINIHIKTEKKKRIFTITYENTCS